ncbi:MAG TPA: OmpH family outer membrane protein [Tepidisphaeraceae bacterium]|jgi:Skp family chaperone for outer membrane proteins
MQIKRVLWAAAVCGSMVAGCKEGGAGGGGRGDAGSGTAVVNVDKVAKDLGWMNQLQANQQTYTSQLKNEFEQYRQKYEQLVQEKAKSMIPPGTKEGEKYTLTSSQAQDLSTYIATERQQLAGLNQEANQLMNNYKLQWVKQYREALSPIVRQVAQDRKANVVLTQTDLVMFVDRSVDLTDAVVDAARARPPSLTQVPMDHLQGPSDIRTQQGPTALPQTQPASQPTTQP